MDDETAIPDERLELLFTCCHPALALDAQVALTLWTLGGLTTEQIARAFLVLEETMAKRLVRAKRRIKARRPVVELNRAAAMAEAGEAEAALALVDGLELDRYHYLHATRAELLRRLERLDEARAAYDQALELVHSDAERRFLERRVADLR